MASIREGTLSLDFPDGWRVSKYDNWSFYRNQFQSACDGAKAVDILAIDPDGELWLIEIKDYSRSSRTKAVELPLEIALKVRDTLAGLVAARTNANDAGETKSAGAFLLAKRLRVVLHLEQPANSSRLFPQPIKASDIQQKLRQLVRAIDAHPKVCEISRMNGLQWTVTRCP